VRLEERLKQIEKRIAELQRKADAIKLELVPAPEGYVEKEHLLDKEDAPPVLPRRRGRRKLNEAE
jgi:SMC interacting uncharacterized protein involved in chromosome segregation